MAKNKTNQNLYGIIGLGRFGTSLAEELIACGKDVICLDIDETKLTPLKNRIDQLYLVQQINRDVLLDSGIQNCQTVIICIGKSVENSIMAALNVIELGVPNVIAKANTDDQGRVLKKIGAKVVFPEVDMGYRLAKNLTSRNTLDFLALNRNFSIIEFELHDTLAEQTVADANLRGKFHLNIIALIRGEDVIGEICPDTKFEIDDRVVVAGNNEHITLFSDFINKKE